MSMGATHKESFLLDSDVDCGDVVCTAKRRTGLRDRVFVAMIVYTLIRSSEVIAGEQAAGADPDLDNAQDKMRSAQPITLSTLSLPESLTTGKMVVPESENFSATEFTQRKPSMFDRQPAAPRGATPESLRNATVWQRLSDFRSHDRVRLLTLWETPGSSVSLQAGKRGGPSLQWSSRVMNHGGATRGLLDKVFSASLTGAGNVMRNSSAPRPAGLPTNPKAPGNPAVAPIKIP